MPTFDMICVGTGGGPDETNLSAYLLKPCGAAWEDGIIALEAGSGQGALNQILKQNPNLFASPSDKKSSEARNYSAAEIYSSIRCYIISHVHLDHINSLVISAGSLGGPRKRVYSSEQCLKDLESVFSDRLWPNLASWNEEDEVFKLLYTTLHPDTKYTTIHPDVSLCMVPVNHGKNGTGPYESAAFFIRHDPTHVEFLFFGDVEPDTIASTPQNINVWRIATPKILAATLSTIFIECSWPSGRPDDLLYGHLSPEHLVAELEVLASELVKARNGNDKRDSPANGDSSSPPPPKKQKTEYDSSTSLRGALDGLRVYVMHCKDTMDCERPISHLIVDQVRALVARKGLGAEIIAAEQGMRIEI